MAEFQARNPDFEASIWGSFHAQGLMRAMGMEIVAVMPGRVEFAMGFHLDFTQQHGFMHAAGTTAGMDTACGCAAMTLMEAGSGVLTVEFKTSLMSPAAGERFRFTGEVIKPGRTLTFTEGRAYAIKDGAEKLIATMTATMMSVQNMPEMSR